MAEDILSKRFQHKRLGVRKIGGIPPRTTAQPCPKRAALNSSTASKITVYTGNPLHVLGTLSSADRLHRVVRSDDEGSVLALLDADVVAGHVTGQAT